MALHPGWGGNLGRAVHFGPVGRQPAFSARLVIPRVTPARQNPAPPTEAGRRLVPDLITRDVYMCGPPGLMSAVRTSLRTAGLPPDQLHEERFGF